MSQRSQIILIWWSLIFMNLFGLAWAFLIGTLPLPPATMTAQEIAQFYLDHSLRIRLGAAVCSWTSAFIVPVCLVVSVQMARLEKGVPIWAGLQLIGGTFTSLFVVLPSPALGHRGIFTRQAAGNNAAGPRNRKPDLRHGDAIRGLPDGSDRGHQPEAD